MSLLERLRRHARQRPHQAALVHPRPRGEDRVLSYAELVRRVEDLAGQAAASTACLPILAPRSPAVVLALLACRRAARPFAVLPPRWRWPQVEQALAELPSRELMVGGAALRALAAANETSLPALRLGILAEDPELPATRRARQRLARRHQVRADWPPDGPTPTTPASAVSGACALYTSGSTGRPKGVWIGAEDLDARAAQEAECFELTSRDVLLGVLPFSFDVGFNQLLASLHAGATLVLQDSWLGADLAAAVARHGITGISGVPTLWQDMQDAGLRLDTRGAHASLRYLTISGGDLSRERLDRLGELAPDVAWRKTYGQTETFRSTTLEPTELARRPDSVGRPLPGVHVYVVDPRGRRCAAGIEGDVLHTGTGTLLGSLAADADPRIPNPFRGPRDPAPWAVRTGDRGWLDADGYLYLAGRQDDLVKIHGNRVYPREAARHLEQLPAVRRAEVVAAARPDGRTILVAFYRLAPGLEASAATIRQEIARRVPPYLVPTEFLEVSAWPRTTSGKIDRPQLVRRAEERLTAPGGVPRGDTP